jgi:hypothetical protein
MTIVRKISFGLEEIRAVVFECNECKARIVLAPDTFNQPPDKCPLGHSWEWNVYGEHERVLSSPYILFLRGLKKLREPLSGKNDFTVYLEFDEPKS